MKTTCPFCLILRFKNFHSENFFPVAPHVIEENEEFILLTDFAPIVQDHILIIPKVHNYSIQEYISTNGNKGLLQMKKMVKEYFKFLNLECVFFEHGTCDINQSSACIEHAHLHCLPLSDHVVACIKSVINSKDVFSQNVLNSSYLYLEHQKNKYFVKDDELESQVFRKIISKAVNKNQRNKWQKCFSLSEKNFSKKAIEDTLDKWKVFKSSKKNSM